MIWLAYVGCGTANKLWERKCGITLQYAKPKYLRVVVSGVAMDVLEPTEKSTNGTVTLEIEVSDPVMERGIETRIVGADVAGLLVTEQLAEHIQDEYYIDVEEHGVEVAE